jgi:hypothetical protein
MCKRLGRAIHRVAGVMCGYFLPLPSLRYQCGQGRSVGINFAFCFGTLSQLPSPDGNTLFMTPLVADWSATPSVGSSSVEPARLDHEVVELQLLLPRSQVVALEAAARSRGLTTGQMLRRVIADVFPAR